MNARVVNAVHKFLTLATQSQVNKLDIILSVFIENDKLVIVPSDTENDQSTLEYCNTILEFARTYALENITEIEPSGWKPSYGDAYQYAMDDIENKSALCIRWKRSGVYISTVRDEEILISDYRL